MLVERLKPSLILVLALSVCAIAQLRAPLAGAAEPFSISPGSTFTASGGTRRGSTAAVKTISNDIREAQQIILGNHFDAGEIKPETITKSALAAMLHSLDPHSNYHDPVEWKELIDEQHSGYTGIGATIGEFDNGQGPQTYVLSAAPGSAAAKAKLKFGDRIVSIRGRNTTGLGLETVRDLLRGHQGTIVEVVVERSATGKPEALFLQRTVIRQPSIPAAFMLRDTVGYIDLTEGFNYSTSEEFDRAMRNLKGQGMRSLVLDLRWNGGGILDQAVKIAEKFLPAGTQILSQRGRFASDTRSYYSTNAAPEMMPLVVLVNSRTASASEILAGAFQDCDRALIVGEKTYGKGLVQTVIDLPDGAGLTLTTGRYLTPSGRSIQRYFSTDDLYGYYHSEAKAEGVGNPFFEARTVTDRRVFGGDGIHPDESVKGDRLTAAQTSLLDPLFLFAVEVAGGRIKRVGATDLVSAFGEFIVTDLRIPVSSDLISSESAFIQNRLRYYLTVASSGLNHGGRVLIDADHQVDKAIEALPRASRLAKLAASLPTAK